MHASASRRNMTHCTAADRTDPKPPGNGRRQEGRGGGREEGEQKERPDASAMHLRAGVATGTVARYPGKRDNARPFRINSRAKREPARRFFREAPGRFEPGRRPRIASENSRCIKRGSVCLSLRRGERLNKRTDAAKASLRFARE